MTLYLKVCGLAYSFKKKWKMFRSREWLKTINACKEEEDQEIAIKFLWMGYPLASTFMMMW